MMRGREVAAGLDFPEGPVWLPDGSLLVVEIAGGTLKRIAPDGRVQVVARLGGGPNGAALGPDGHVYVCNNGGFRWRRDDEGRLRPIGVPEDYQGGCIQRVELATGRVEVIYDSCDGRRLCGPNDLVFDGRGGFWFTDFGKVHHRQMDRGAVYHARMDGGAIREAIFPVLTPNGIGLAADGRSLFVAETETSRLWRWPVTAPGMVDMEPWPSPNGGVLVHGAPGYQRFDSLALEEGGNIVVATLVRGGLSVFSPDGALLEFVPAPEPYCTNICFGGPGRRTAFVTLSGTGRVLALNWPRAGAPLHDGA